MGKEEALVLYLGVYRNDNLVACHTSKKRFLELAAGVLPRIPSHLRKFSIGVGNLMLLVCKQHLYGGQSTVILLAHSCSSALTRTHAYELCHVALSHLNDIIVPSPQHSRPLTPPHQQPAMLSSVLCLNPPSQPSINAEGHNGVQHTRSPRSPSAHRGSVGLSLSRSNEDRPLAGARNSARDAPACGGQSSLLQAGSRKPHTEVSLMGGMRLEGKLRVLTMPLRALISEEAEPHLYPDAPRAYLQRGEGDGPPSSYHPLSRDPKDVEERKERARRLLEEELEMVTALMAMDEEVDVMDGTGLSEGGEGDAHAAVSTGAGAGEKKSGGGESASDWGDEEAGGEAGGKSSSRGTGMSRGSVPVGAAKEKSTSWLKRQLSRSSGSQSLNDRALQGLAVASKGDTARHGGGLVSAANQAGNGSPEHLGATAAIAASAGADESVQCFPRWRQHGVAGSEKQKSLWHIDADSDEEGEDGKLKQQPQQQQGSEKAKRRASKSAVFVPVKGGTRGAGHRERGVGGAIPSSRSLEVDRRTAVSGKQGSLTVHSRANDHRSSTGAGGSRHSGKGKASWGGNQNSDRDPLVGAMLGGEVGASSELSGRKRIMSLNDHGVLAAGSGAFGAAVGGRGKRSSLSPHRLHPSPSLFTTQVRRPSHSDYFPLSSHRSSSPLAGSDSPTHSAPLLQQLSQTRGIVTGEGLGKRPVNRGWTVEVDRPSSRASSLWRRFKGAAILHEGLMMHMLEGEEGAENRGRLVPNDPDYEDGSLKSRRSGGRNSDVLLRGTSVGYSPGSHASMLRGQKSRATGKGVPQGYLWDMTPLGPFVGRMDFTRVSPVNDGWDESESGGGKKQVSSLSDQFPPGKGQPARSSAGSSSCSDGSGSYGKTRWMAALEGESRGEDKAALAHRLLAAAQAGGPLPWEAAASSSRSTPHAGTSSHVTVDVSAGDDTLLNEEMRKAAAFGLQAIKESNSGSSDGRSKDSSGEEGRSLDDDDASKGVVESRTGFMPGGRIMDVRLWLKHQQLRQERGEEEIQGAGMRIPLQDMDLSRIIRDSLRDPVIISEDYSTDESMRVQTAVDVQPQTTRPRILVAASRIVKEIPPVVVLCLLLATTLVAIGTVLWCLP